MSFAECLVTQFTENTLLYLSLEGKIPLFDEITT